MSNDNKEILLVQYVKAHEEETCDCNEDNMELCLGGNYTNNNLSKEEIFNDW